MRLLKKYLLILAVAMFAGLMMNSCAPDEEDIDYRLTGTWGLVGDEYGPLPELDDCEFLFRSNGTGLYWCYDEYGYWTSYPLTWWADGVTLTVSVSWETWTYQYTLSGGWLTLYPIDGTPALIFGAN